MPNYAKEDYTPEEIKLWEAIRQHEGEPLRTVKGLTFTYRIRGNELLVDRKEKSITRATVNRAFRRATASMEKLTGPKQLGTFGASYLFPLFCRLGILKGKINEALSESNMPEQTIADFAGRR